MTSPRSAPRSARRATVALAALVAISACASAPPTEPPPAEPTAPSDTPPEGPDVPTAALAPRAAGYAALEAGDHAGAIAHFEAAEAAAPGHPALALDRAIAHAVAGDFERCERHAQRAHEAAPALVEPVTTLIQCQLSLGVRGSPRRLGEALVARYPRSAAAWYALGAVYWRARRHDRAMEAFERALREDPDDLTAQIGVLAVLSAFGDATDLPELERELLARAPDNPWILNDLGVAAHNRGDIAEARAYYERALAAAPAHAWAHYNLARLLHVELDEGAAARPHYEAFLRYAEPSAKRAVIKAERWLEELR